MSAHADPLRLASFNTELSRKGPGLLLRDILKQTDDVIAVARVITHINPHIIALQDIDYDADNIALTALADLLREYGADFPYVFSLRPNTGRITGLDMDGDGKLGEAQDAQGYGRFAGDGGMGLLSKFPIQSESVQDYSNLLWKDLPNANLPKVDGKLFPSSEVLNIQRLSTTGHWIVPISISQNTTFSALMFHATPPVFDGPEDRNGLRNHDEITMWSEILDGKLGAEIGSDFAILGTTNLDPVDGEGLHTAMTALLSHPKLHDPQPSSIGAIQNADPSHQGPAAHDTVDYKGPGNLRVDYVLPSSNMTVTGSGVFWPDPAISDILGPDSMAAGRHRLVWVDVILDR